MVMGFQSFSALRGLCCVLYQYISLEVSITCCVCISISQEQNINELPCQSPYEIKCYFQEMFILRPPPLAIAHVVVLLSFLRIQK